jgi:hypothetical protein
MSQNLISASLSAEDAAAIIKDLNNAKSKLNFLSKLLPQDLASLIKVGNAYLPFVEKAHQVVVAHPEILPGVFDKEEFKRDYDLLIALRPILNQVNELAESVQKTFTAAGSDSLVAALDVYSSVKQNKDKVPGLSIIADEMAVFFKRTRTKVAPENIK